MVLIDRESGHRGCSLPSWVYSLTSHLQATHPPIFPSSSQLSKANYSTSFAKPLTLTRPTTSRRSSTDFRLSGRENANIIRGQ